LIATIGDNCDRQRAGEHEGDAKETTKVGTAGHDHVDEAGDHDDGADKSSQRHGTVHRWHAAHEVRGGSRFRATEGDTPWRRGQVQSGGAAGDLKHQSTHSRFGANPEKSITRIDKGSKRERMRTDKRRT
jgi:hypothetical protein